MVKDSKHFIDSKAFSSSVSISSWSSYHIPLCHILALSIESNKMTLHIVVPMVLFSSDLAGMNILLL